jgi:hypothetical protein
MVVFDALNRQAADGEEDEGYDMKYYHTVNFIDLFISISDVLTLSLC